jgi:hypothetical protein
VVKWSANKSTTFSGRSNISPDEPGSLLKWSSKEGLRRRNTEAIPLLNADWIDCFSCLYFPRKNLLKKSLSSSTHITILCKFSFLNPFRSIPTELSLKMHRMTWNFYQTSENHSKTCCQNLIVSAIMVLQIQSNKAHRLQTTNYRLHT